MPGRTPSRTLVTPVGEPAVKIEALAVKPGDVVRLRFETVNSPWRQGVWLGTSGRLSVGELEGESFDLWADTAPPEVRITVEETEGSLVLYNVWDRGRNRESQKLYSGMWPQAREDGSVVYSCHDSGMDPSWDTFVFSVRVE